MYKLCDIMKQVNVMNAVIFVVAVVILLADQVSKGIIQAILKVGQTIRFIPNFFDITYIHNEGAAWGMMANRPIVIIVASLIALFILYRYMYSFRKTKKNEFAFGLLLGGITGNLIDRVLFGYVRDFLDFHIFGYDFPVFNIADTAIVVGVFLLIIAVLKGEDHREKDSSTKRRDKN